MSISPPQTTRSQLIRSACRLFAAHGYDGASISAIARELGLTKQALLHHFGSKDALYALAVEQTAAEVVQLLFDAMQDDRPPEDQLEAFFAAFMAQMQADSAPTRLLIREMLDHVALPTARAGTSLHTLFEGLVATVQATQRWQDAGMPRALVVVTQILGAASLMATTGASLEVMFGRAAHDGARDQNAVMLSELVSRTLRG